MNNEWLAFGSENVKRKVRKGWYSNTIVHRRLSTVVLICQLGFVDNWRSKVHVYTCWKCSRQSHSFRIRMLIFAILTRYPSPAGLRVSLTLLFRSSVLLYFGLYRLFSQFSSSLVRPFFDNLRRCLEAVSNKPRPWMGKGTAKAGKRVRKTLALG